jgi:acetyl esterase/lipase
MARRTGILAALGALLTGCSASGVLNTLVAGDTYKLREGVAYGADPRKRLDVYQPLQAAGPVPVIVFFYGGNWTRGSREAYRFVGEALAASGAVAIVADYRLSPEVRWTQILADCALATRWAFDQAAALGGDPARIFLMGHSAGAYNAAMLALDPRWLAAEGLSPGRLAGWVGIAGPYDFLPVNDPESRVAFHWPDTPADSQPIHHVSAGAPRALLMAARDDKVVNPQRSTVGLASRLQAAGAPVQVELFDKVNHATVLGAVARPLNWLAPVLERIQAFAGLPGRR